MAECAFAVRIVQLEDELLPPNELIFDPTSSPLTHKRIK